MEVMDRLYFTVHHRTTDRHTVPTAALRKLGIKTPNGNNDRFKHRLSRAISVLPTAAQGR
jgi:hypothetical protein